MCVHVCSCAFVCILLCLYVCACVLPSSSHPTLISQKAALLTVRRLAGRPSAFNFFFNYENTGAQGAAAAQATSSGCTERKGAFQWEQRPEREVPSLPWPSRAKHCRGQQSAGGASQSTCCSLLCCEISGRWAHGSFKSQVGIFCYFEWEQKIQ